MVLTLSLYPSFSCLPSNLVEDLLKLGLVPRPVILIDFSSPSSPLPSNIFPVSSSRHTLISLLCRQLLDWSPRCGRDERILWLHALWRDLHHCHIDHKHGHHVLHRFARGCRSRRGRSAKVAVRVGWGWLVGWGWWIKPSFSSIP